jgi:aryl-alcohol dehydrogenase-like predicted oxidoreductase
MRRRSIGRSGPEVSAVGLGANNFGRRLDLAGTRAVVDAALDAGVTLIDTADLYGDGRSEQYLGEVLNGRRDQVVLASKFGWDIGDRAPSDLGPRGGRRYLRWAVEASLRRLRTDRIDLYQYHRYDGVTPLEETVGALEELVDEGKILYAGCSNLSGAQIAALGNGSGTRLVSAQNAYSLLDRRVEAEAVPVCVAHGLGVLPYYPLANGLLSGKVRRNQAPPPGSRLASRSELLTAAAVDAVARLSALATQRGRTLLELAVGWLASRPWVASVIAGAMSPEQVRANAAAAAWTPDEDALTAIDAIVAPGTSVLP